MQGPKRQVWSDTNVCLIFYDMKQLTGLKPRVPGFLARPSKSFPECAVGMGPFEEAVNTNACRKTESFNNLRRAAFLHPTDARAWEAVACVKEQYFGGNGAEFYHSLAQRVQKSDDEILEDICNGNREEARLALYLPESSLMKLLNRRGCHPRILSFAANALHPLAWWISNPRQIWETVLAHPDVNGEALFSLIKWTIQHARDIPDSQEILEKAFSHTKIDNGVIWGFAWFVADHVDNLPNFWKLVEIVLSYPEITPRSLWILANPLRFYIDGMPPPLLERFVLHPNHDHESLGIMNQFVSDNADKISHAEELLEEIQERRGE